MNNGTAIGEITDALNGYYREHEKLPRFIEINYADWAKFGCTNNQCAIIMAVGLLGGVPVIPLASEKDWTFAE